MIDADLTIPASPDRPAAVPGAAVFYSYDDGDSVRPYVVTADGVHHEVAPAPVDAPAHRLTSPGFHGATIPSALVSSEHIIGCMGAVDHDVPAGALVPVLWRIVTPGVVGWAEVVLVAGPVGAPGRIVGTADITAILGYPASTQTVEVTTTGWIARGETLWLAFAAWVPPGWTQPLPRLLASAYPDPIASGGVARVTGPTGETRPSVTASLGQPYGGDPYAPVLPFVAAVLVP